MTKIHFLWGFSELKRRLLAEPQMLYSYYVFRDYSLAYLAARIKLSFSDVIISLKQFKFADYFRDTVHGIRKQKFKRANS